MYRSDSELLYKMPPMEVKAILRSLSISKDPQYLDLLRALCTHDNTIIYHNQRIIITELFQNFNDVIVLTTYKGSNRTF